MTLAGFLAIVLAVFVGGCAGVPPGIPHAGQNSAQQRAEAELQDAKAAAAALRADLAGARITAAKQEAELRELRRQVDELRHVADARHAELTALREERDRLTEAATVAQVRVADSVASQASADEVGAMKARLRDMETALAALTTEVAQMKKDMGRPESTPQR